MVRWQGMLVVVRWLAAGSVVATSVAARSDGASPVVAPSARAAPPAAAAPEAPSSAHVAPPEAPSSAPESSRPTSSRPASASRAPSARSEPASPAVRDAAPIRYIPPVPADAATITDHFRPPPGPYAAGNRGLDYATAPGTIVVASAAGRVVFAGRVAGGQYVTVAHPDGRRTTYSFLAEILVAVGAVVDQGQAIGVTGTVFHFGVRDRDGSYLDPEALFDGRLGAHLVPGPDEEADADRARPAAARRSTARLARWGPAP
jgi:murein DD-endopeptidase MepM/ murein hydrolase activator NlpD